MMYLLKYDNISDFSNNGLSHILALTPSVVAILTITCMNRGPLGLDVETRTTLPT